MMDEPNGKGQEFSDKAYDSDDWHLFDCEEAIACGKYSDKGKVYRIDAKSLNDVREVTLMKSDTTLVRIPELDLEEAAGTGRYTTIEDLVKEMKEKLETALAYFKGPSKGNAEIFLRLMNKIIAGKESFTLLLNDPLGNTYIKEGVECKGMKVTIIEYTRTWEQNQELGLPSNVKDI